MSSIRTLVRVTDLGGGIYENEETRLRRKFLRPPFRGKWKRIKAMPIREPLPGAWAQICGGAKWAAPGLHHD